MQAAEDRYPIIEVKDRDGPLPAEYLKVGCRSLRRRLQHNAELRLTLSSAFAASRQLAKERSPVIRQTLPVPGRFHQASNRHVICRWRDLPYSQIAGKRIAGTGATSSHDAAKATDRRTPPA
jgi:hypothetical protein